jgi:hypothetical protein
MASFAHEPPPATTESKTSTEAPVDEAAPVPAPTLVAAALSLETIAIGRGNGGRALEVGQTAGGYQLFTFTWQRSNFGLFESGMKLNKGFRFEGGDKSEILKGKCTTRAKGNSLFGVDWKVDTARNYACVGEGVSKADFSLEVLLPVFRGGGVSLGGFSISTSGKEATPEQKAALRARMKYRGVVYDALPTGFSPDNLLMGRRVVNGYTISRDGVALGGVTFVQKAVREGTITAPVAGHADREAVLFLALQLHAMPDIFSSVVRDELFRN